MPSVDAVAKIFANVSKLQTNDDNYVIFAEKIRFAAASVNGTTLLTTAFTTDQERELDHAMLAAIMMKLSNAIFIKNISIANTQTLLTSLKTTFDIVTAMSEAVTERELFMLKCSHAAKLDKYLDKMIDL